MVIYFIKGALGLGKDTNGNRDSLVLSLNLFFISALH